MSNLYDTIDQPRAIDAYAMLVVDATSIATKCWNTVPPKRAYRGYTIRITYPLYLTQPYPCVYK